MNRSKLLVASMGGAAILACAQLAFAVTTQTRSDYTAAVDRASTEYKGARAKCEPLTGHDKDRCSVEAKAAEKRAKASAEANYRATDKAKSDSRIADADADFMVAKVACDTKARHEKDQCMKQAKATHVKLVADARGHKISVDARAESREDTREAQREVALAKCDAMSGIDKDTCVTSARAAYAK